MADIDATIPDPSWDLNQLSEFIRTGMRRREQFRKRRDDYRSKITDIGRQNTANAWRIGKALVIAQEQLTAERDWLKWLKQSGIKQSTAYDYIDLAKAVTDETQIADMTLTQARRQFLPAKTSRKRKVHKFTIPEPTPETALDTLEQVMDVIDAALMAAKEGTQDQDRLDALMTRLAALAGLPKSKTRQKAASTA